jgi:uncharacterized protein (DUF2062 family)
MKIKWLEILYDKLVKINDSPQKTALGFGLGVFLGIFPGAGPLASIFLAVLLRVNRIAALLGCLLTNTWISFITFGLATLLGAKVFRVRVEDIAQDWQQFIKTFNLSLLFKFSVMEIAFPIVAGYVIIGIVFGFISYLISLAIVVKFRHKSP